MSSNNLLTPIKKFTSTRDGITAAVTMFVNEKGVLDCLVSTHINEEEVRKTLQQNASDARAT